MPAPRLTLVAALLFCSGCCGLVFQVAWMRELRLVFGATTAASAAVLAIFMGGLGLGNAVLGRRADRSSNPLAMYGLLEIGVALCVAASPWLVALVRETYIGLGGVATLGMTGATLARLLLSSIVLGVPTFLMGGTLPAAARAVTSRDDGNRHALATLYAVNTLGAVVGTVLATFYLLEHFGNRATLWIACGLNLTIGILAYLRSTHGASQVPAELVEDSSAPTVGHPKLAYFAAGLLGFTFFLMELVWYRMLGPILGGTTFTFGLILAVALFGIGLGGLGYNVIFRRLVPTWSAFALTCALEALAIAVPYAMGDRIAVELSLQVQQDIDSFRGLVVDWFRVALRVVCPAAIISGVQFPLLLALLGKGRNRLGRQLGNTYAANTAGSILGSLAGGFGAIPLLSALGAWKLVVALLLGLACLVFWVTYRPGQRRRTLAALVATCALALICVMQQGPTAAWRHSGVGAGRSILEGYNQNSIRAWLNACRRYLVEEADGVESSVGLVRINGLSFYVNGKADGNSLGDAPTQIGLAIVGATLHPEPRSALVIGLGTGQTCGWLADMRGIERVDVVELEPAIDRVAELCSSVNRNAMSNPRITRIYNDAREAVLTADTRYDLIVSEPSNPYRAGVATLFTREFYRSVRERLNEGGLFVQWVQAYEIERTTLEMVLATLQSEFTHVEVWQGRCSDLLVVCSTTPPDYTLADLQVRIADPTIREGLRVAWYVDDVEGFLAHFLANEEYARTLVTQKTARMNTDDRTILEYEFAKSVGKDTPFSSERFRQELATQQRHRPRSLGDKADWSLVEKRRIEFNALMGGGLELFDSHTSEQQRFVETLNAYLNRDCEFVTKTWPLENLASPDRFELAMLAHSYAELGRAEALELAQKLESVAPPEADAVRAVYAFQAKQPDVADHLQRALLGLREYPWGLQTLSNRVIDAAVEVASEDPALARRFCDLLKAPFAADRLDERRKLARAQLALRLDAPAIVEALGALEPHVPWEEPLLETRKVAYQLTDHPLQAQAAQDLADFRSGVQEKP